MSDFHGIIFAYGSTPELGELVRTRTAASLPFCGRYRLIDFALSSLMNVGIHNVGVIMQRDYQSLLDHLGSGKDWDMGRKIGGLRMLPPFGLPEYHTGNYVGTIEALNAVRTYVEDINEDNIVMLHGNLAANLDLSAAIAEHVKSGAEMTAVCTEADPGHFHHRFVTDDDGFARRMVFCQGGEAEGLCSLEAYIISKALLLKLMDACFAGGKPHFHRDAVKEYIDNGGKVHIYVHKGYARRILSVGEYFAASMDMLRGCARTELFPDERPVRTKSAEDVSTYYGENAVSKCSLVADGCIIEGEVKSSVIFPGVRLGKGAKLTNCIVMRGSVIGEGAELTNCIIDKQCVISPYTTMTGAPALPVVLPKRSRI